MGAIWLGSLPDVLRRAGLNVAVYPRWETRSRSSGGYDALLGIQCHHTASSGANPAAEMAYMWDNASSKPIGALYLAPDGKWTVGAAGATNTSGKGGPLQTSRGTIPLDAANRYVISIEAANRGDGSRWPDAQLDSYVRGVAALNAAYFGGKLAMVGDVHAHFEWTSRKVDPAGSSWYAIGASKWDMGKFRSDVVKQSAPPIYAGLDSNGTDYNKHDWIVPGGGGGLVLQGDWSVRTASLRNGVVTVGAHNSYSRPMTRATYKVPFEVSGEIFLHSRLNDVVIFGENRVPTWNWGVNFHPVFVDEDNNIVTGFAPGSLSWSASGQINKAYGIPRAERYTPPFNHDAQFGAWHRWRVVVPATGVHEVYWDDQLVYRVVEKNPPAAWWGRPMHVALRLDFYDYSLKIHPPKPPSVAKEIDMLILDFEPGTPKWTAMQLAGDELTHLVNGHHVAVMERGGVPRVKLGTAQTSSKEELKGVLLSVETTNASPFAPGKPAADADLHALWVKQAQVTSSERRP